DAALPRIDDGGRPLVLDHGRSRHRVARWQARAVVARHLHRSRLREIGAMGAGGACGVTRGRRGQGQGLLEHTRGDAEVDALHVLSRGIAVELAMTRLEGRLQRSGAAGHPTDLQLVVLSHVAEVYAPLHGQPRGIVPLIEEGPQTLPLEGVEALL